MELVEKDSETVVEIDWDIKALAHPLSKYTVKEKIEAITLYVLHGNVREVSRRTGVPENRIHKWKSESQWWGVEVDKVRKAKQEELDAVMTSTIHTTLSELNDRVAKGDYQLDKNGDLIRVPLKAKDLAVTAAIIFDKRSLIRGDATRITTASTNSLQELESKFKEFAKELKEKDVVSEQ